ncbi:MAG TPA: Fic family protein [Tepidisphaeraceae bacterium]|jgi:Fic family protein
MMTFRQFSARLSEIPATTGWYLADLGESLGKQALYTKQSPQKLKALREHALIESAISSNRIEGVEVEQKRITTLMFGQPLLKDRDEEEVRGYRDALELIHEQGMNLPINQSTVQRLHAMCRGEIWDAGKFKEKAEPIIEKHPDGRVRVRFMPVQAGKATEQAMGELMEAWEACSANRWVHPLVAVGALGLDFLCIHPFRDGNGRVSRLLMLLASYHAGTEVGRYISLERLIEQNKDRYYETLEQCSQGWHDGKHNPWPFINYVLWILKAAYKEFEQRVGETAEPKGAKAAMVREAVAKRNGKFRITDIERACSGVGREWIRTVLAEMQAAGEVTCTGRGPAARWQRVQQ